MKKLTKIRLINWHYFSNETIDCNNHILLTGQNATGKSTILDAITFVITAGDTQFNLAANDHGKRDLKGYVKCKIGTNEREYLREGDCTGHIALEFHDEAKDRYFTVGCVIDAFRDLLPSKSLFYSINDRIFDRYFVSAEGNRILNTVEFKKTNTQADVYLTKKEAKRAFRSEFGSLNEDFFKLIPKALAFKPISDVKDFIYQHLLEEKEIDVTDIKDAIRSYKELERTLALIKAKIKSLQEIDEIYTDLKESGSRKQYFDYILKLFGEEAIKAKASNAMKELSKEKENLSHSEVQIQKISHEIESLDERSKELYRLLSSDEDFMQSEYLDKQVLKTKTEVDGLLRQLEEYSRKVSFAKDVIRELRKTSENDTYKRFIQTPLTNLDISAVDKTKLLLIDYEEEFRAQLEELQRTKSRKENEKADLLSEINTISQTLRNLENRTLDYDPMVLALKSSIQTGLKEIYGYEVSVYVLAELLEITNHEWQDTIEVYLGNRRFNLIVEPRYFDAALQIYNRIKGTKRIYGVGLINTKKISGYNNSHPQSLASIVTSDNLDAKRYVNFVLGKIIMCASVTELENHDQAITIDGMLYSGFTVSSLNYNIRKPYIGKDAIARQTETWGKEALRKKEEFMQCNNAIMNLTNEIGALDKIDLRSIISGVDLKNILDEKNFFLEDLALQKKNAAAKDPTEIENDYNKCRNTIKSLESKRDNINRGIGSINQKISSIELSINEFDGELQRVRERLAEAKNANVAIEKQATEEIKECFARSKDVLRHTSEFEKKLEGEEAIYKGISDRLSHSQFRYNTTYNTIYGVGVSEIGRFIAELNLLEKTEVVKYEKQVREKREKTEILFKEDFLSKLRNNIMAAEEEFKKINETLRTIQFGQDSYEFIFPKSKEYGVFYDIVTTDIDEGDTGLFTIDFEAKYQLQLEELFANLSQDELNASGAINKFTDYRTYMDYDIKITSNDNEIYYSKVSKEKSGGETQVPFYVAIIASFVRIYTKVGKFSDDKIGIVMFDEVFDKMDSSRMRAMMSFICTMPLQIVFACPPEKMDIISEFTDTTIITLRDRHRAFTQTVTSK